MTNLPPKGAFADRLPKAESEEALLAFAFREAPLFRQGYDRHVRQWTKHMRRRVWVTYFTHPGFAAAYDSIVQARQSIPLPPMRVASCGGQS